MLKFKIKSIIISILVSLLVLPFVFGDVEGPYEEYLDNGFKYEFERGMAFIGGNITNFECLDSNSNTYQYTTESTIDWIRYTCNFTYDSPPQGKGISQIYFIIKYDSDGVPQETKYQFNFYYGYCPNVPCPTDSECIDHECVILCGNGEINEGETCSNCPSDVRCSPVERCVDGVCQVYCGNGQIDQGETCLTCPSDVRCSSTERCIDGMCKYYCGNGQINPGEDCDNCPQDVKCSVYKRCKFGICQGFCGNGQKDSGEDCASCPQDVKCSGGLICIKGKCLNPDNDPTYCGPEGKSCGNGYCINGVCLECRHNTDCESKQIWKGKFICSPDNKNILEEGYELSGTCKVGKCTGEKTELTPRFRESCKEQGCQGGTCGCLDGFKLCKQILECKKQGFLQENAKCDCDFECESGYCSEDNKCINTLNVKLSTNKDLIEAGEQVSITLSVDNNLNKIVNTNLAVNVGNGFDITEVDGGMHCSGNQCKSSVVLSERSRTKIMIGLEGKSSNVALLNAEVNYLMEDGIERSISEIEEIKITITDCGDKKCSEGETTQNCCIDCGCPKNKLFSFYTCNQNRCDKKTKGSILMVSLIIVLIILIFIYSQIHHHIVEIITKKTKNKCPRCKVILRKGEKYCHKCGRPIRYIKRIKDLSHLFKERKKFKKKGK